MFTGIVEGVGRIIRIRPEGAGSRLTVDASCLEGDVALGDSVAIDGICLTVEAIDGGSLDFRATRETLDRTTLGHARPGHRVNLERSLRYGARVGGHLVSGHVDGLARVTEIRELTNDWRITFEVPPELRWCLVEKGSIAVDGISLTIVRPSDRRFSVAIVRYTLEHTSLSDRRPGDSVHVEGDVLGRWVAHLLGLGGPVPGGPVPSGASSSAPVLDADRLRALGGFGAPESHGAYPAGGPESERGE
jgi:riboflavin synthase